MEVFSGEGGRAFLRLWTARWALYAKSGGSLKERWVLREEEDRHLPFRSQPAYKPHACISGAVSKDWVLKEADSFHSIRLLRYE